LNSNWGSFFSAVQKLISILLLLAGFIFLLNIHPRSVTIASPLLEGYSLRFYGHGVQDIDRVKVQIDAPAVPADVGVGDFTIEWWLKANPEVNEGNATCNVPSGDGWITGNTILDRDIYGVGDHGDFGVSLSSGQVVFGISSASYGATICSSTRVDDGLWHHIAVTRSYSIGQIRIFIDGVLQAEGIGPTGDVSYRDNRQTSYLNDPFLVIGAEKYDAGSDYPSFIGWIDELRISSVIRYTTQFPIPIVPFIPDENTAALYHFDEGPVGPCTGIVLDIAGKNGASSHGQCSYGGSTPAGPEYSIDQPFIAVPTQTATATETMTPSQTATETITPTQTATETITPTQTAKETQTPTQTATATVPLTSTPTSQVIDTTPPEISDIEMVPFDRQVIIRWQTNEPAVSQVRYGINNPPTNTVPFTTRWSYAQSYVITNLAPETTYFIQVISKDYLGNMRLQDPVPLTTLKAEDIRRIYLPSLKK
jgi:hypothetical protein